MPSYLITYDLRKVRNYKALADCLKKWGGVSPLESVWLVNLKGPAGEIMNILRSLADRDDGFMVVELAKGADWSTYAANAGAIWLNAYVTKAAQ